MECDAYSSRTARHPRGFTQRYAYDPGCLRPGAAPNFVHLLSAIHQHLHTSSETQWHYISIAQGFQSKLCYKVLDHQPSLDDFTSFIIDYWPTFQSIAGSLEKVLWGRVSKQPESPCEVGILSSLICICSRAGEFLFQLDVCEIKSSHYCSSCRPIVYQAYYCNLSTT